MPTNNLDLSLVILEPGEIIRCFECKKLINKNDVIYYVVKINKYFCHEHGRQWREPPFMYRFVTHQMVVK